MGRSSEPSREERRPTVVRDFDGVIHWMWPARPFLHVPQLCGALDLLLPYQTRDALEAPTCLWCAIREEPT